MSKVIVLMGPPGAGKGTQARLLEERLQLPQISTGDMFRALWDLSTPLAREVRATMEAGGLVSDDLTVQVVRERTQRDDCRNGYVLDGFPRTPAQADMLTDLAREQNKRIQAILVDIPRDVLEKRMVGRRTCPICGEIYNIYFRPPANDNVCDRHPEATLVLRSDDIPETVRARLATYEKQTRPLVNYYRDANLLDVVDGSKELEVIFDDIKRLIGRDN